MTLSCGLPASLRIAGAALASFATLLACHRALPGAQGASLPLPTRMIAFEPGRFQPGGLMSQNEWAVMDRLLVDQTEVTVAAYAACVQAGHCAGDKVAGSPGCNYGVAGKESHPMNCVSRPEATAYCRAQGKRLPTPLEWEWAARSSAVAQGHAWIDQREDPWGDEFPFEPCWSGKTARAGTCAVGTSPAGDPPGGVQDLAGNVSEWTAAHETREASGSTAVAPDLELLYGCNWDSTRRYACVRNVVSQSERRATAGFRCVK